MAHDTTEPCAERRILFIVENLPLRLWRCNVCRGWFALSENARPECCPLCAVMFLRRLVDDVYYDAR
jgi:rubrerythrin